MRIAISATGTSFDAPMDERFGRCPCFVITDPEGTNHDMVENIHAERGSGAGIQAARLLIERASRLFSPADAVRMPPRPWPQPESGSSPDAAARSGKPWRNTPQVVVNLPRATDLPRQPAASRRRRKRYGPGSGPWHGRRIGKGTRQGDGRVEESEELTWSGRDIFVRVAIASGKGGTGKTTVATNLAWVAARQEKSVVYLDCDVEEPNGQIFLKPDRGLA